MPDAAAKLDAFWTVNVESQPYHLGLAMAWPMVNPSMIEAYRSERTDLARLHPALPQCGAFLSFLLECHVILQLDAISTQVMNIPGSQPCRRIPESPARLGGREAVGHGVDRRSTDERLKFERSHQRNSTQFPQHGKKKTMDVARKKNAMDVPMLDPKAFLVLRCSQGSCGRF